MFIISTDCLDSCTSFLFGCLQEAQSIITLSINDAFI